MQKLLFFFFIISSITLGFSQEKASTLPKDKSNISQKKFDAKKIEAYKKNSDFNYEEAEVEPSFLEIVIDWIKHKLIHFFSWLFGDRYALGIVATIFKVLPYIVLAVLLFLIIKFFLRVNSNNLSESSKNNASYVKLTQEEELLTKANLSELIAKALQEKNYRLAIRYQYINVIKKLQEKEIITWEQQKTNEDYSKEITNLPLKNQFNKLTFLYDFVWYGNFKISEDSYQKVRVDFDKITSLIPKKLG